MIQFTQKHLNECETFFYPELKRLGIISRNRIPVSMSPYFISQKEYLHLQYLCEKIHEAIEIFLRAYVQDEGIQLRFPELGRFRSLSLMKPPYYHWIHLARFDIARNGNNSFKLLETNCDCPGGIIWYPLMKNAFQKMSVYKDIVEPLSPFSQPIDSHDFFIKSLITTYQEANRTDRTPMIAFLTSAYRPILTDMHSLSMIIKDMGLHAAHSSVQELYLHSGQTMCAQEKVDVVYQKFDAFIDQDEQVKPCIYEHSPEEVAAYWKGLHENQFMVFNSFPSAMVAENKRILALLQEETYQPLFTQEQKQAIAELCPKTFTLESRRGTHSLLPELLVNKDQYVLKRTIDTQGRGVILGRQCSVSQWKACLEQAIDRPYIVQEYIDQTPHQIYSETLQRETVYGDLTMFMIAGKASGLISRSSRDLITNVAQNGNFHPVFVVPQEDIHDKF